MKYYAAIKIRSWKLFTYMENIKYILKYNLHNNHVHKS